LKRAILYLDDEVACVDVFQEMFGDDFDVRTTTSASEARRALDERAADIVISDQRMPEIEGTEFLREIAETHPASYRVILTGSLTVGEVLRELGGVINLFVSKPWTEQSMRQILERACASFDPGDAARHMCASQTPVEATADTA
jgi:DNA-binding NtrC family response regulator